MRFKLCLTTLLAAISLFLLLTACDAKKALYVTRALLGYIPPPEVPSVMDQLKEELERCERSGEGNCEEKAVKYVRLMNKSLQKKPYKGEVIITRDYKGETSIEYDPETTEQTKEADKKD